MSAECVQLSGLHRAPCLCDVLRKETGPVFNLINLTLTW